MVGDGKGIWIGAGRKNKDDWGDKGNLLIDLKDGDFCNGGQESKYPEAKSFNKNGKILTVQVN